MPLGLILPEICGTATAPARHQQTQSLRQTNQTLRYATATRGSSKFNLVVTPHLSIKPDAGLVCEPINLYLNRFRPSLLRHPNPNQYTQACRICTIFFPLALSDLSMVPGTVTCISKLSGKSPTKTFKSHGKIQP